MILYLSAIVVASFLGSAHCVGMCGPMALLATGMKSDREQRLQPVLCSLGYHLGRATTYLILGLAVGWLGAALNGVTEHWGWIGVATWMTGWLMIGTGMWQLWQYGRRTAVSGVHGPLTRWWLGCLQEVRRWSRGMSPPGKAYVWGFLTTWLPCGWLYTFVLVAASAGSIAGSLSMMAAFWLGTLPALTGLTILWSRLRSPVQRWMPAVASLLLIAFGSHVVFARSQSSMGDWLREQRPVMQGKFESSSRMEQSITKALPKPEELPPCCRP